MKTSTVQRLFLILFSLVLIPGSALGMPVVDYGSNSDNSKDTPMSRSISQLRDSLAASYEDSFLCYRLEDVNLNDSGNIDLTFKKFISYNEAMNNHFDGKKCNGRKVHYAETNPPSQIRGVAGIPDNIAQNQFTISVLPTTETIMINMQHKSDSSVKQYYYLVDYIKDVLEIKNKSNWQTSLKKDNATLQTEKITKHTPPTDSANSSGELNPAASFLQGSLEGCIDAQKKILSQKGVLYEGNEELVSQYCHCFSPMAAEILSTPDKREKMMNGDPEIKEQLKKVAEVCRDGVQNGRHFGP